LLFLTQRVENPLFDIEVACLPLDASPAAAAHRRPERAKSPPRPPRAPAAGISGTANPVWHCGLCPSGAARSRLQACALP